MVRMRLYNRSVSLLANKIFHRMGAQVPQVEKSGLRKMTSGIATGNHVQIRRQIGVHVATVCLIVGEDLTAMECGRPTGIDDRFGEKHQALITQKLFVGIIGF